MIKRYEIQEISSLWSDESRFKFYLKVEIAHLKSLESQGIALPGSAKKFNQAKIDPKRISEIEKITNHDVIAFCSSITEQFSPEDGRFFHFGLTSSDVIDTAHALLIKETMAIIEKDLQLLEQALLKKAQETSHLLCLGRSHGISAEAMIFGQKFLSFKAELERRISEWKQTQETITGQLSGAVGNYTIITPEMEDQTLKTLGLKTEKVSTQIIPRDHYAKIISLGALIGTLIERIATELRLLQHSDIDEAREGFSKGQKGSSTMPHKKNPISSENLTGMARLLRSHLTPMLENCVLWHERDISHSSVERMILPDHFGLLAYSLRRMKSVIENLQINSDHIEQKVQANEKIYSSLVLHKLIELNRSIPREDLYSIVQSSFFKATNKDELKKVLKDELESRGLKHKVNEWINLEYLRNHYQKQFEKILNRSL